jgi:parallel beta-helix repeat protein
VIAENEVSGASDEFTPPGDRFGDGIFVGGFTAGTLLRNNLARDNADDGIQVLSPAARLRDNLATDNGDFGIDAAAGVTDLGGNGASGNGNPLQCRNVFCG